jgi:hypothetical protein
MIYPKNMAPQKNMRHTKICVSAHHQSLIREIDQCLKRCPKLATRPQRHLPREKVLAHNDAKQGDCASTYIQAFDIMHARTHAHMYTGGTNQKHLRETKSTYSKLLLTTAVLILRY